jgi:outer membrane protein assembly factor BamB
MRWQFPPTGLASTSFLNAVHGNDDYRRPGAAWNDVFIVRTGGESLPVHGHIADGYDRLHALNAYATTEQDRVRWIADRGPPYSSGGGYSLGAPTVTGGIVFIETNKGRLVVVFDPSVDPAPTGQFRCSNIDYTNPSACTSNGYAIVPIARVKAFEMPDGGSLAAMRNEPVLAKGRVFVATTGHVYMLEP